MKLLNTIYAAFLLLMLSGCTETTGAPESGNQKSDVQQQAEQDSGQGSHTAEENNRANGEKTAAKLGFEEAIVKRAVDGDTVELADGRRIRLIGVNTPESTTIMEEYGKEASRYTSESLKGKKVWLQKDVSETDRYGRFLRIVWLEVPSDDFDEKEIRSKMFNARLILNGYAEPSTYNPDVKYSELFAGFAREARSSNTGLWEFGANGTTKGDLDSQDIEGEASSKKDQGSGDKTDGTVPNEQESFKNCTELRKVHPNGVPSTHPAYASRHDRDKDDWACEK
jgi:micrococcal nuclease